MQLPGAFSPLNAIKQVGSVVNPTGGVTNYDIFGNLGNQRTASSQPTFNVGSLQPIDQLMTNSGLTPSGSSTPLNESYPTNGAYTGSGGTYDAAAAQKQSNVDYVNRAFDTRLTGLRGQLDALDPQRQAAELQTANQWQTKMNDLNTGLAQGQRNLNYSRQQVQEGRERGLKSLRDQLQQQAMSYSNQLGAYGAGDSSAAGLINFALAGQTSRNRGDVMGSASQQETEIGMQEQDLNTAFEQNRRDLDTWKQQTLAELANSFAQQKAAIQNEMLNADLARQQQLAQYDASLTQSAIDRLSQIEGQFKQQSADLVSRYQNMFAPQNIQIAPNLQQYQVQAINPGQIAGLSMPNAVNPESEIITAMRRRDDEQLQNPLAY